MMKKLLLLTLALIMLGVGTAYSQLKITEIRVRSITDGNTDTDYIEISGTPGATIPANTRIVALSKGGGTDAGVVTGRIQSIAGLTIPSDGYMSIGRTDAVISDLDLVDSGINWQSFQNLTFLIVDHSSFIASTTDVDADDDGVIDNAFWTTVIDGVSLRARTNAEITTNGDEATRAWDYSQDVAFGSGLTTIDGITGSSTLHHIQRNPLTDAWEVGDSIGSYSDQIYDSHSNPNSLIVNDGESITVSADVTVYNVIVKSGGSLTVAAGASLEILNKVINNGTFTINSGASLVETSGVFEGNDLMIQRTTQHASDANRHNFVGSPVSSFNIESLNANAYYNYDEGAEAWSLLAGNPVMTAGQGYSVVGKTNLEFVGIPNSGTVAVNSTASAFKLLSNPYPCAISIDEFFTENSASLSESTLWLWNDGGSDGGQRPESDYLTVNSLGMAQSGTTGAKASSNFNDGSIGSMQGFFVSTSVSGTSISFTNDMKESGNNGDAAFFRKKESLLQKATVTLSSAQAFSEILLAFTDLATEAVDKNLDASKLEGNASVQLSGLIEQSPFTILANPLLQGNTQTIDLEYDVVDAGSYSLQLSNMINIPEEYVVTLIDHQEGISVDITGEAYTFHTELVTKSNRFSLRLTEPMTITSSKNELNNQDLVVYQSDHGIKIKSDVASAPIAIYDLSGHMIHYTKDKQFIDGSTHMTVALKRNHLYLIKVGDRSIKFFQQ